jgi:hypothetical protein
MWTKYELLARDGSSYRQFETNLTDWWPGMDFRASGHRLFRIVSVAPDVDAWVNAPQLSSWSAELRRRSVCSTTPASDGPCRHSRGRVLVSSATSG